MSEITCAPPFRSVRSIRKSNSRTATNYCRLLTISTANGSPIKTYGQKSLNLDLEAESSEFSSLLTSPNRLLASLFHPILKRFPDLTNPVCRDKLVNHSVTHSITTHGNPVKVRARRLSSTRYKIAKDEFKHTLNLDIIHRSSSNWPSALHLVPKKSGDWHPCSDYLALNSITVSYNYFIPNIQDFLSNLRNKKFFSKTAIVTLFGLFEFLRIPFGLRNAAQTFQNFIDEVLHGLDFIFAYIDEILVTSENEEEHKKYLEIVFERLNFHELIINLSKSGIGQNTSSFLGNTLPARGFRPTDEINFQSSRRPILPSPPPPPPPPPAAVTAFEEIKILLANCSTFAYQEPNSTQALFTDSSQVTVGVVRERRQEM
ncbi:unnamed protein product [Hymenolepis diminuta]|uniref:Reverse transcriptase domain-containing protein n=1 Tax=Hymenolepis diminuta TaxID=6216 RepID=A0A0R3SV22_HYMDI|nr:unnamed protein product [Hymenolepis diminuta]